MSRSRRFRPEQRRPGQHHGRFDGGGSERRRWRLSSVLAIALSLSAAICPAQSLLHIRVLEGEGAVHVAGSKVPRGLVVQVTDETGKPVDGVAVSFRMPEEGPGMLFARGMRTDIAITADDGRAAVHDLSTGSLTGPFQVRITAVKGVVRAGTIASQYVTESASKPNASAKGGKRKWIAITALVAGGAAAGLAAGMSGGKAVTPTPTAPPAPPQIGTPSISIGKP